MTEYRHQPLSARIDFCPLKSDVVLFILCKEGHIELPLRNKQNQKLRKMFFATDCSLPVLRFVVPSRISCGEIRKTCCISVCICSRPSFRPTPGPMPRCCVLCMDQSEGPTQPGVDDSCVTIGLRGRHTWGRLYLSFILMFRFFLCVQLLFFFFFFFTASQRLFILI